MQEREYLAIDFNRGKAIWKFEVPHHKFGRQPIYSCTYVYDSMTMKIYIIDSLLM